MTLVSERCVSLELSSLVSLQNEYIMFSTVSVASLAFFWFRGQVGMGLGDTLSISVWLWGVRAWVEPRREYAT
jgi:hypothetical protein